MAKQQLGFRVPDDTYERFEEYREEGATKSDAAVRLLERGLDAEQSDAAGLGLGPSFFLMLSAVLLSFAFVLALLPVLFVVPLQNHFLGVVLLTAASAVSSAAAVRAAGLDLANTIAEGLGVNS